VPIRGYRAASNRLDSGVRNPDAGVPVDIGDAQYADRKEGGARRAPWAQGDLIEQTCHGALGRKGPAYSDEYSAYSSASRQIQRAALLVAKALPIAMSTQPIQAQVAKYKERRVARGRPVLRAQLARATGSRMYE